MSSLQYQLSRICFSFSPSSSQSNLSIHQVSSLRTEFYAADTTRSGSVSLSELRTHLMSINANTNNNTNNSNNVNVNALQQEGKGTGTGTGTAPHTTSSSTAATTTTIISTDNTNPHTPSRERTFPSENTATTFMTPRSTDDDHYDDKLSMSPVRESHFSQHTTPRADDHDSRISYLEFIAAIMLKRLGNSHIWFYYIC